MRVFLRLTVLSLLAGSAGVPKERSGNWSGNCSACDGHSEFTRALDFWATVLDMEWHEDSSRACAIQIVDGAQDLFIPAQVARAQLPNRFGFQGWIAFNSRISLPPNERFFVAVRELGHLFGLPHNSNASSIMFYLNVDEPFVLDSADLSDLAARHKLRICCVDQPFRVSAPRSPAAERRAALVSRPQAAQSTRTNENGSSRSGV